ncbi:DUF853 family protein [Ancylobacter defluvii]|uniref:Helicase HerA central domain-containing protein n=1 Tax=Ancylobacter defluvii TaxID=1282440 RepID=A0A9W6NDE2_9HYPH|nr:DUF853 family protein [Ancylobacter defluvii]MBS7588239.1 ATP-binding protein [Ancylobacter defluvii]GLK86635.1 hypothetical protein GCM10017653_47050 [Ancylobacter defluvii]
MADIWSGFSAFIGRTGAGKSYAARGVVETFLDDHRRVCIVDPTGVWWGLRSLADGGPGFPVVIFGGEHADVPIEADAGGLLGALIGEEKVSASIVDVSEFSTAQRTRFLTDFFEALYGANRSALHLVLDEADEVAPQNPMPETKRLLGAVDRIVRRGRVRGFRPMMITQRPAVLHKNVLSQIGTLVALRLTSPQDRNAIGDWVKGNADGGQADAVMKSLSGLDVGEGWTWCPALDVLERKRFPGILTLDSSRTPEHGEERAALPAMSAIDVEHLRQLLGAGQEPRADAGGTGGAGPAAAVDIASIEAAAYQRGFNEGHAHGRTAGIAIGIARAQGALNALRIDDVASDAPPPPLKASMTMDAKMPKAAVTRPTPREPSNLTNSAARKMLAVLDTNPPVRRSWQQVATLAGLKARGGHFNAGRKAMIESGLIVEADGLVAIASPSAAAGPAISDPATMVDLWAAALSGAAPKVLRALFEMGGTATRPAVAERLGMQPRGGHWNAAWKELRDNSIVTVAGDMAELTELFHPGGQHD